MTAGKITYDEKVVTNSEGDYITLEVTGNKTAPVDVFKEDLGQGEKVVREFTVDLKPPAMRSSFFYYLLCICTLGLYYIKVHYCHCCRKKLINTRRGKLALTNKGRMGVWIADTLGVQGESYCCGCIRGDRSITSRSYVSWFHVNDLSHMQHYHYVSTWNVLCCCLPVTDWESSLRLFFGVFPDQALVDAYNTRLAVPKTVSMDTGLVPDFIASYFNVSQFFNSLVKSDDSCGFSFFGLLPLFMVFINMFAGLIRIFTFNFRQGLSLLGLRTLPSSVMLEISTGKDDTLHINHSNAREELIEIQKALLAAKKAQALGFPVDQTTFQLAETMVPLVKGQTAFIDTTSVALMPKEEIKNAFTYACTWTFREVLFTIMTFGWYYFLVVRYRHGLRSALVLTNFRLFELSQDAPVQCCAPSKGNFTYISRSWFLNGLDTGIVAREKRTVWTQVQTQYGAIRIEPFVKSSWIYGLSRKASARALTFLKSFAAVSVPKVFNSSVGNVQLPRLLAEDFPLLKDEDFIGSMEGFGHEIHPITVCGLQPPTAFTALLFCGIFPLKVRQDLAVTSNRILACAQPSNSPWCFTSCLTPSYKFHFWSSLSSRYFIGIKTAGQVYIHETCFTRILKLVCNITASAASQLSLSYTFTSDKKGYPISIEGRQLYAGSGLLENPGLTQMRSILGLLHAAKAESGPDPYFAAPAQANAPVPVQQYYQIPVIQYTPIMVPVQPVYDPRYMVQTQAAPQPQIMSSKVYPQ